MHQTNLVLTSDRDITNPVCEYLRKCLSDNSLRFTKWARGKLASTSAVVRQKAVAKLKQFAADHPGTDAGAQAEEWLAQVPQGVAR